MASNKTYWKSMDQLNPSDKDLDKLGQNEFVSKLPEDFSVDEKTLDKSTTSRRDFLKYAGFSTAAATIAACEGPIIKSVPYVFQPEQIRPGIANYYATTIADGYDFASILIKTREGRPIKVESNTDSPVLGSANARVHASVLSLYDSLRLKGPLLEGRDITWDNFYREITAALNGLSSLNKKVIMMTPTLASPTTKKIIDDFVKVFPNITHVIYDSISSDSALNAFEKYYGIRALADYDFSKVDTIVGIDSDFLGDWQGGGYEKEYAEAKRPKKRNNKAEMSWHMQFESNMSLTGVNADHRVPCTPAEQKKVLAYLHDIVRGVSPSTSLPAQLEKQAKKAANRLLNSGANAVVVSGIDDEVAQSAVLEINSLLKSKAFQPEEPKLIRQGNSSKVNSAIDDIINGNASGLITFGLNPVFTTFKGAELNEAIKNLEFSLAFTSKIMRHRTSQNLLLLLHIILNPGVILN